MAPSREACAVAMAVMAGPFLAMASNAAVSASASANSTGNGEVKRRRRTSSTNALQRTASDVSAYELHHHHQQHGVVTNKDEKAEAEQQQPAVPEAAPVLQHAKCECCGMSQECTPQYIRGVRARFAGRWVCGLCAEAVTEEAEKKKGGGTTTLPLEEALKAHMGVCKRFNGFGRTHPVLFQAEAMREILRRRATLGPRSRSSINPREVNREVAKAAGTGISRSSSCMTFIADHDFNDRASSSINKN